MRVLASRKGFSLVELLTVIAIIAILASIIFPVMGMVNNKARMNKCVTQLHQIGLGVQMFKQDNRRYPDMLAVPVHYDGSENVIPMDRVTQNKSNLACLYPEYVKGGARMFHCPNSKEIDAAKADTDPGTGWQFYPYDSYDFMRLDASRVQQHYTRSWCILGEGETNIAQAVQNVIPDNPPVTGDATTDYERQLKFRTPPDNTVVTWCSYHESGNLTGRAPTLYLDGHVDQLDASQIEVCKWRTLPKKE